MNERDAFIRGIAANPYDDTPRLAFADWLDEHGEHDRAEFIRVQCELEPIRDQYEIPRAAELHDRETELLYRREHYKEWAANLPDYPTHGWHVGYEFRRGFIDTIQLPAGRFITHGNKLRAAYRTIRRVVIFQLNGWGKKLAACRHLKGLPELELACWYSDDDIRALAASKHLAELQVLMLWLGRLAFETGPDRNLCRIAAEGKAWPHLRELTLLDPEGTNEKRVKRLVTAVNKAAGRKVGRYERGYAVLFPFAPGNRVGEPGYLPDGRMVLVSARATGDPPRYEVLTFDKNGEETGDVLYAPVPPELLALPKKDWYLREHEFHHLVCQSVGLRSAFIRIKNYRFPSRPDDGAHRGHYDEWDRLGVPDPPPEALAEGEVWDDGNGEAIYHLVRNGEFTVAQGGWWCNKSGHVHST